MPAAISASLSRQSADGHISAKHDREKYGFRAEALSRDQVKDRQASL
jgi:hypothetical protein